MSATDSIDRENTRLDWARRAIGDAGLDLQRASMDAGFRSYWRTLGPAPAAS